MNSSPRRTPRSDAKAGVRAAREKGEPRLRVATAQMAERNRASVPVFPYRYFRIAIEALSMAGTLPHRIDRSVWANKHFDITDADLVPAFQFLGLIDAAQRPLPLMKDLVEAFGRPHWAQQVQRMLEGAYRDVLSIGIGQATPKLILELFRKQFGLDAVRARIAAGFFVHAVRDSQMDAGPFLQAQQKPAPPSSKSSAARERVTKMLLARLPPFDFTWSDELKLAWLLAFRDIISSD